MPMVKNLAWLAVAAGVLFGTTTIAQAQMTPQQAIDARKALMQANNGAVRGLTPIIRGEAPWNQATALQHANVLLDDANKIPTVYPDGTFNDRVQGTRALPAIATRRADFNQAARNFLEATQRLVQLAQANDEAGFKAQFPRVGAVCGTCHEPFRAPQ